MIKGNVLSIALTGGPCAGKTSALSQLMEWLTGLGYRVAIVPEAATELINSGIRPQNYHDPLSFQYFVLENICNKEEMFAKAILEMNIGDHSKPAILLCDRGIMDIQAYIGEDSFLKILIEGEMNLSSACDIRYVGVLHLRTAADGAEEYYTLANNNARRETPEEARALDRLTEEAWYGHHRLMVIDNSTSFAGKILRTQQAVSSILGIPTPIEYERKFKLEVTDESFAISVPHVEVDIEQYYLNGDRERIRRRTRQGASTFFYTIKENRPGLERVKIDKIISEKEFYELLQRRDMSRGVIRKIRTHFVWENQYFELDYFPHDETYLLEVRLTEKQQAVILPPFLPAAVDVTDNPDYYNYNIALAIKD